jgi:short-subunit dehydrogenase
MMLPEALAGFSQALWDELTQNDLDSRLLFAAPMTDSFASDPLLDVLGSQGKEEEECVCAL